MQRWLHSSRPGRRSHTSGVRWRPGPRVRDEARRSYLHGGKKVITKNSLNRPSSLIRSALNTACVSFLSTRLTRNRNFGSLRPHCICCRRALHFDGAYLPYASVSGAIFTRARQHGMHMHFPKYSLPACSRSICFTEILRKKRKGNNPGSRYPPLR